MSFSVIDIVFGVIVLAFAFMAWRKGLIAEVLGKLAPIISLLVAALFFGQLAPHVVKVAPIPHALSAVVAFLVLFVGTFIIIKILQVVLSGLVSTIDVFKLDKLLGLILGAVEGLFIVAAIMIILLAQPWFTNLHDVIHESIFWILLGALVSSPVERVQEFLFTTKESLPTIGLA